MTLFYPDCSNNNWSSTQDAIDFLEQLVPEGFSGMCHKVSEGNYYEDPYWPTVQQWCQHNNLPLIGYHYVTSDSPASQAQTWLGNNGGGGETVKLRVCEEITRAFDRRAVLTAPAVIRSRCSSIRRASRGG